MATAVIVHFDRPRNLRLTFSELLRLESSLGKPSGEIFADLGKMSLVTAQAILYSAIRAEDPKVKFSAVNKMVEEYLEDGHDIADIMAIVNDVITKSGLFGHAAGEKEAQTS